MSEVKFNNSVDGSGLVAVDPEQQAFKQDVKYVM